VGEGKRGGGKGRRSGWGEGGVGRDGLEGVPRWGGIGGGRGGWLGGGGGGKKKGERKGRVGESGIVYLYGEEGGGWRKEEGNRGTAGGSWRAGGGKGSEVGGGVNSTRVIGGSVNAEMGKVGRGGVGR